MVGHAGCWGTERMKMKAPSWGRREKSQARVKHLFTASQSCTVAGISLVTILMSSHLVEKSLHPSQDRRVLLNTFIILMKFSSSILAFLSHAAG